MLPDWLVQVMTEPPVDSPAAFLEQIDREKALVKAVQDANFK
jgi:hypothetical protein